MPFKVFEGICRQGLEFRVEGLRMMEHEMETWDMWGCMGAIANIMTPDSLYNSDQGYLK